jgi:hypothetical protein
MGGAVTQKRQERSRYLPDSEKFTRGSNLGLGLAQALDAVARFPLAALFEQIDALETLQDVALNDDTAGTLETFVLRHGG